MAQTFDVIVIGSGIGGLTTAAILARLKNKKVLVLEKHYVAGGQTHEFHRNQYSWDVGIHYVGGMAPGESARMAMDYITGKQVAWNEMPDVYDRLVNHGTQIEVHKDPKIFARNLIDKFPAEERAIHQYLRDLEAASTWYLRNYTSRFADILARLPFILKTIGKGKLARMTTRAYMDKHFKDDRLKSFLTAQWGDYGVPPEKSSFGQHALVIWSYCSGSGAFFPEGGGHSISNATEQVIALAGGQIQLDTEVTEILIRDGRAYGVATRQSNGMRAEYHAKTIISNVGADLTYRTLIPEKYCRAQRAELSAVKPGLSMVTLYVGLKESPEKFGVQGENYWIDSSLEHSDIVKMTNALIAGQSTFGFVSFPSMKNHAARGHTAEISVLVDPEKFAIWADRPAEYYLLKDKITTNLLAVAEKQFPGFGDSVDYAELSTPLTIEHYTGRARGEMYGIPGTPARFDMISATPHTPIKGLFLSGSDVCASGIVGALFGGIAAASCVIGPFGFLRIMTAASIAHKKPVPKWVGAARSMNIRSGTLIEKTAKNQSVYELKIKADTPIDFRAGQHVDLLVSDHDKRSYSVLSVKEGVLTLVIDTRPDGVGSNYVCALDVGNPVTFSAPKGNFLLQNPTAKICFISTGTGMVPLMAMLEALPNTDNAHFIFGTGKQAGNYVPDYLAKQGHNIKTTYCLSREKTTASDIFNGRITQYLNSDASKSIAFPDTDFYICGNPNMVMDVQRLLREKGANRIFTELY